jgi:hypothetical protein
MPSNTARSSPPPPPPPLPSSSPPPSSPQPPRPRFDLLLDSCTSVFCVLEPQRGDTLYVSPNVARVFNTRPEALLGCAAFFVCGRPAADAAAARMLRALRLLTDRDARDRHDVLDGVHPLERAHLSAMMRAVRCAPAHAPPALAHMRALRSPPCDSADASADDWLWCEIKLCRDVRARAPRERARMCTCDCCQA